MAGGVVADVADDPTTLSWVNMLLGGLWPKADKALHGYVHNTLTPLLQTSYPRLFGQARFSQFTLGKNTPEFGPIEVVRHSDSHVQIELEMRYNSDVDMQLATGTGGITIGIHRLRFSGRLCISLKPLLEQVPVVAAAHVFFVYPPVVELQYSGLAMGAEFTGLTDKLMGVVHQFFKDNLVLPNCHSFWNTRDARLVDLTASAAQPPLGVLRVRILRGYKLAGANWTYSSADRFTSDPYCEVSLGGSSARTNTVRNSTDPVWRESEPSLYFVVYHREQLLEIEVYCDVGGAGILSRRNRALLGKFRRSSVTSILEEWPLVKRRGDGERAVRRNKIVLDTSEVSKQMLHVNDPINMGESSELEVELEWLDIASVPPSGYSASGSGPLMGIVLVELHTGGGFPEDAFQAKKGLRWKCRIDDREPVISKKGELIEDPNSKVRLPRKLFGVVDRLNDRHVPVEHIADICDTDEEAIQQYMKRKEEEEQRLIDRQLGQKAVEEVSVDLSWYQTVPLLLVGPRSEDAQLLVELLDGEDRVVGKMPAVPVSALLQDYALTLRKAKHTMEPVAFPSTAASMDWAAWLFPACQPPVRQPSSFKTVRMEFSVQLLLVTPGAAPRAISRAATSKLNAGRM